jgi:hypothetical protein
MGENTKLLELLDFDREVCTYWSPDKKCFAVTHYGGSKVAGAYICNADDTFHPLNVTALLPEKVSGYFRKGILHG